MGKCAGRCFGGKVQENEMQENRPVYIPPSQITVATQSMWRQTNDNLIHDNLSASGLTNLYSKLQIGYLQSQQIYLGYIFKSKSPGGITYKQFLDYNVRQILRRNMINSFEKLKKSLQEDISRINQEQVLVSLIQLKFLFRYAAQKYLEKGNKNMKGVSVMELYKHMVIENPGFDGLFDKRFFLYLKEQREDKMVTLDQWECIPIFLKNHSLSLHEYGDQEAYPMLFDSFVQTISSNFVTILSKAESNQPK